MWAAFDRGECTKDFLVVERFRHFLETMALNRDPALCNHIHLTALGESTLLLPHAEEVCRTLLAEYGLRYLIFTAGENYSVIYSPQARSYLPTPKVEVVDTVGAGDCFAGVFAAKLAEGKDVGENVKTAARAAAVCVTRKGAAPAMPDAGELEHFCSVGCLP